ncbi:MAG TPA: cytochrome D ubiquinol oxidase subunit I, partial [Burkholderiaceae bacterium]|nr:cytochrome D ubiquinol oxidase subunit I [Burkholderiaceae bacterium]
MKPEPSIAPPSSLDPADWRELRAEGHKMLDDIFDYLEHLRERPVWQPIPQSVRSTFQEAAPSQPQALSAVHETFMHEILPYAVGNSHPGFMGWVQG